MKHPTVRPYPVILALLLFSLFTLTSRATDTDNPSFISAKPVWPKGRELEKNVFVGFRAVFEHPSHERVFLRATGATLYRVFVNGEFLAHGPARGPHGFYRLDEWDITDRLKPGKNVVAFEVAGYNANSYSLLDQPSFLSAEIVSGGKVLAATGGKSFSASLLPERIQKVQRYSFQRPFSEAYQLTPGYDHWRTNLSRADKPLMLTAQPAKALLPRRVSFPDYDLRQPSWIVSRGDLKIVPLPGKPWKDRSLTAVGPNLAGFPEKELSVIPSLEMQTIATTTNRTLNIPYSASNAIELGANTYEILDLGVNLTGFIGMDVTCRERTHLLVAFDEILSSGDVDFKRLGCVNVISYDLEPGTYHLESIEPYTLRYLKLLVTSGAIEARNIYLREFAGSGVDQAHFAASDERLNRLFAAGRETLRQNALDIFMDCPSRERAGWLCDSYFTARSAKDLCGDTRIEKNFLENFLLPKKFEFLPEGMLPMCYPADHNDGVFIPNWSLWFVLELEEYLERSGDRAMVEALRPRVLRLLEYFKQFRNEDGLLEKLPSWVFVEWSAANSFVQDVNFPSNMLYARVLAATGKLYDLPQLTQEAETIRQTIRSKSYDGRFFVDNQQRVNGKLVTTTNRTEVCQYFAFYLGVATSATHPELWQTLVKDFGPQRKQTKAFPEIHPANAFVGNILRLELLSRYGLSKQLLDESVAYQLYMADRTGTLWENDGAYASCNHGFASHGGVHVLFRDVLGLRDVDTVHKTVTLRFTDNGLEWCTGRMPTPDGLIELNWRKVDGKTVYKLKMPAGYNAKVESVPQMAAEREP